MPRLSLRGLPVGFAFITGFSAALACGAPNDQDFGNRGGEAGEPSAGGSSGSAAGGSSGTNAGGASHGGAGGESGAAMGGTSNGGSPSGGSASGGDSGTGSGGRSGGTAGTEPTAGVGGSGAGSGEGGSSGGGGRGDDCSTTVEQARRALAQAQVCMPATDAAHCRGTVEDLCGCTVPVDDPESTATKTYLSLRERAIACGVPCLAIVCPEPTTALCQFGTASSIVAVAQCVWGPR